MVRRNSDSNPVRRISPREARNRERRRSSLEPEERSPRNRKCLTCLGHSLRITHFILNGFAWVVANLAIFGGFVVGFTTNTVIFPFVALDFMATTPIILLVEYGLFQVIVASIGCFTGTGANPIMIILYIICAIILLIVDLVWGVCLYFWPDALPIFMRKVRASMNGYEVEDAEPIGIYPLDPKIYWDHIQLRIKCCGTELWDEWFNTTIGRRHSFPYSCCNDDYRYSECGDKILGPYLHPFNEHHDISDMVFQMGCFAKLPKTFKKSFRETDYIGVITGAFIIFALLIAIVLLILILTRLYNPDARKSRKYQDEDEEDDEEEPNRERDRNRRNDPGTGPKRPRRGSTEPEEYTAYTDE